MPLVGALIGLAVLFSAADLNDNHHVRTLPGKAPASTPLAVAPDGTGEFEKWLEAQAHRAAFSDKYPVYIVAAEGGGIYAAYHVAAFLARLQEICPQFSQHLLAISSVSGGSVGGAVYAAHARTVAKNVSGLRCIPELTGITRTSAADADRIDAALGRDLLSPLIAAAFFPDFMQRFLPLPLPALDRARALEQAIETAWREGSGHASKIGSAGCDHLLCQSFLAHWDPKGATPALLINTTEVGSGRRRVIAPFKFTGSRDLRFFLLWDDAYEIWSDRYKRKFDPALFQGNRPAGLDIPLSTAAVISARFPWVTPAAWFNEYQPDQVTAAGLASERKPLLDEVKIKPDGKTRIEGRAQKIRLVDGGYFENSGVATAMDLIKAIEASPLAAKVDINLIVLASGTFPEESSYALGEATAPVNALLNRSSPPDPGEVRAFPAGWLRSG